MKTHCIFDLNDFVKINLDLKCVPNQNVRKRSIIMVLNCNYCLFASDLTSRSKGGLRCKCGCIGNSCNVMGYMCPIGRRPGPILNPVYHTHMQLTRYLNRLLLAVFCDVVVISNKILSFSY